MSASSARIDDAARLVVERHVQRHDVGLAEQLLLSTRAARRPGKSPSMMYGSQAITRAEDVARDVRHALADAPEPEDAERQVGGARAARPVEA